MHSHDLSRWQHDHVFDLGNVRGERATRWVVVLTAVTMVGEILAGWVYNSLALLADGWHMATHVVALGISALAYWLARRWHRDHRFAFGTWKIEILGAFSSAIVLALVAVNMIVASVARLLAPSEIEYQPALIVAVAGLLVNLGSAWLLHVAGAAPGHGHDHGGVGGHARADGHGHDHGHAHSHAHDMNLRSASAHVMTDALTSVLAIVALAAGMWLGWRWLDPAMALVGAAIIVLWAIGLLRESAAVLLDREMDHPLVGAIRKTIASDGDAAVADLHVWRVGRTQFACVVCVVADRPKTPDEYRHALRVHPQLMHISVEVNRCPGAR